VVRQLEGKMLSGSARELTNVDSKTEWDAAMRMLEERGVTMKTQVS
jgi:hypothetical protein